MSTRHALLLCAVLGGCFFEPGRPVGTGGDDQPPGVARLAAGNQFACAIRDAAGTVACWGQDSEGQLGVLPPVAAIPTPTSGLGTGWTAIAGGAQFGCGLKGSALECWGTYASTRRGVPHEVTLPGGASPAKIFAGANSVAIIDSEGNGYVFGELLGTTYATPTPLVLGGVSETWSVIAVSEDHACALGASGHAYCWGDNSDEQLGVPGPDGTMSAPIAVPGTYLTLTLADSGSCGITTEHTLACWGSGIYRQEMHGSASVIDSRTTWSAVALAKSAVCGIVGGSVECYGVSTVGQLGNGFRDQSSFGVKVVEGAGAIAGGRDFFCATVAASGDVMCWGTNQHGEMGNHLTATTLAPAEPVPLPTGVLSELALGPTHSCVLVDGQPYCWGGNVFGESVPGGADAVGPSSPATPPLDRLDTGSTFTCGDGSDGQYCWGSGDAIGGTTGTITHLPANTQSIGAGDDTACFGLPNTMPVTCRGRKVWDTGSTSAAVMVPGVDGDLVAVGTGVVAAVANNTLSFAGLSCGTSGITIGTGSDVNKIVAAQDVSEHGVMSGHVCLLHASAPYLQCIGPNEQHQITNSAVACVPSPMTIAPPVLKWIDVSVAVRKTCAIDGDAMYCWGEDLAGELGGANRDAPQQINTKPWEHVALGSHHACGIATDGKVYCWGLNVYGEAGPGEHAHGTPTAVQF